MISNPSEKGSKSTTLSYRTLNFFLAPEKYRCFVVNPSSPVSWWTVSSNSIALLRKVPCRIHSRLRPVDIQIF